jgi:hypothetical protein
MLRDLTEVLAALYESEINAGLCSLWDDGFTVWLGDELNGRKTARNFRCADERTPGGVIDWPSLWAAAADWLHQEAIRHYPASVYAKRQLS